MGLAAYEIVGDAGEWRVGHDGKAENVYQTKESAFEAAVAAASLALRRSRRSDFPSRLWDRYRRCKSGLSLGTLKESFYMCRKTMI